MKITKILLLITLFIISTTITWACTDGDGDGFNASENGCCNASLNCDCDDSSANIHPPSLSYTFSSAGNFQMCNGTYSIPTGGTFMATTHNNNITCRGTTFQGNGSGYGFYIAHGTNITIKNCTFNDYENGILVNNISNGTIHNNSFYNNIASDKSFTAFSADNVKDTNITSNFFKSINGGNGMNFLSNSAGDNNVRIEDNRFEINSTIGIFAFDDAGTETFTIDNNTFFNISVEGNIFYIQNISNSVFSNNIFNNSLDSAGATECVYYQEGHSNSFINNTIINCGEDGIDMVNGDLYRNNITNNTFINCGYDDEVPSIKFECGDDENGGCMSDWNCSDILINQNTILDSNDRAIQLNCGNRTKILNNNFTGNSGETLITTENSEDINISWNNLSHTNGAGISLDGAMNSYIGNNLFINLSDGALETYDGGDSTIVNNNITTCGATSGYFSGSWSPRQKDATLYLSCPEMVNCDGENPVTVWFLHEEDASSLIQLQAAGTDISTVTDGLNNFTLCLVYDNDNDLNETWFIRNDGFTDCDALVTWAAGLGATYTKHYEERDVYIANGATSNYTLNFNSSTDAVVAPGLQDSPFLAYNLTISYAMTIEDNGNTIYNNYFNNTNNPLDQSGSNQWNTTLQPGTNIMGGDWTCGNFWNDYTGTDNNGDMIGDTAHTVQTSGQDNCPIIRYLNVTTSFPRLTTVDNVTTLPFTVSYNVSNSIGLNRVWVVLNSMEQGQGPTNFTPTTFATDTNSDTLYEMNISTNFTSLFTSPGPHSMYVCANDTYGARACRGPITYTISGVNVSEIEQIFYDVGIGTLNVTLENGTNVAAGTMMDPMTNNYTMIINTTQKKFHIVGMQMNASMMSNMNDTTVNVTPSDEIQDLIGSNYDLDMGWVDVDSFLPAESFYKYGIIELNDTSYDTVQYCNGTLSDPTCNEVSECNSTISLTNYSSIIPTDSGCYLESGNLTYVYIDHFSGVVGGKTTSSTSSSSTHSGGGGSDSTTTEVTESDTTVKMREGQYKSITYNGASHKVTIKDIDRSEKKITIEVRSDPQTFTLSEGENVLVDLDDDNDKDLSITFVSLDGVEVYVTIEDYNDEPEGSVSEQITIDLPEETVEEETTEEVIEEPVTIEETFLEPSEEDVEFQEKLVHGEEPLNPMTAIIAGFILLILVTIYEVSTFMYLKHKKGK